MKKLIKRTRLVASLIVGFFVVSSIVVFAQEQENVENDSLVGRINHIEGQLLRYVPDEDDWLVVSEDTPFGTFDLLYSSDDARVEIIMPNNTLLRIGGDTQVQLIELTSEVTEIDVSSGTVRLYNKSSFAKIKGTTPFGDVIMPPETVCDLYVRENQAELVSLKGSVEFTHSGSSARSEVIAGSSSIIATSDQVTASASRAGREWDAWNAGRDVQWAQRMQKRGDSEKYLPESLQDDAYELEKSGRWERVYYEGAYNYFWRPAYVSVDWTPFSCGRWILWHGEHTWVPYERFGYVTHHYGNWIHTRNHWYWAPPVSRAMIRAHLPLLHIGLCWYPGRVAWLHSSISVGWVPLAPFETYYSYRYWGPRSRVRIYNYYYNFNLRRFRHFKHARFIDHHRFYGCKNYLHAGLRKIRRGEKYRGAAFIPKKIRKQFKRIYKNRFASHNPKFKNMVSTIDKRWKKNNFKRNWTRPNRNPFNKKVANIFGVKPNGKKNAFTDKAGNVFKNKNIRRNRTGSGVKKFLEADRKNKSKLNRLAEVNTKKINKSFTRAKRDFRKTSQKITEKWNKDVAKSKKSFQRTSRQMSKNRRTFQKSVRRAVNNNKQMFNFRRQGASKKNLFALQTPKQRGGKGFPSLFKQNRTSAKKNFGNFFPKAKKRKGGF